MLQSVLWILWPRLPWIASPDRSSTSYRDSLRSTFYWRSVFQSQQTTRWAIRDFEWYSRTLAVVRKMISGQSLGCKRWDGLSFTCCVYVEDRTFGFYGGVHGRCWYSSLPFFSSRFPYPSLHLNLYPWILWSGTLRTLYWNVSLITLTYDFVSELVGILAYCWYILVGNLKWGND